MRSIRILLAGAILCLPAASLADDYKHEAKEAAKQQAKADKAQAKADRAAAKYDAKRYREYLKDRHKEDKEWDKLDRKERDAYYEWLRKHGR